MLQLNNLYSLYAIDSYIETRSSRVRHIQQCLTLIYVVQHALTYHLAPEDIHVIKTLLFVTGRRHQSRTRRPISRGAVLHQKYLLSIV